MRSGPPVQAPQDVQAKLQTLRSSQVKQVPQSVQAKLHKAAEDFTAVALNELLKPMFDDTTDSSDGPFGGGEAERTFKPMLITEIAKHIAHTGGLGLAEPVYQQMLRLQEKAK